jgi:hypothetical protein
MKQLLLVFPLAFLVGCTGGTQQIQEQVSAEDSLSEIIEHGPKEIRGTAGDGTSMNVIEVVATNGDTLYITTPAQMVSGGIEAGDEVDIIYNDNGDENTGVVAINISTLTKVWNHINTLGAKQSIELCSNGDVNTWNMPAPAYDSWKLEGGKLLMHSPAVLAKEVGEHTDTFDILSLRKNELVLSLHNHEIIYTR